MNPISIPAHFDGERIQFDVPIHLAPNTRLVVTVVPADEAEQFYECPQCGQAVDTRSLYQVLHHEEVDHEPMSEAELAETSPIESKTAERLEKNAAEHIKAEDRKRDAFASGKKRFTEGK